MLMQACNRGASKLGEASDTNVLAQGQSEAHGDAKPYNSIVEVPVRLNLKYWGGPSWWAWFWQLARLLKTELLLLVIMRHLHLRLSQQCLVVLGLKTCSQSFGEASSNGSSSVTNFNSHFWSCCFAAPFSNPKQNNIEST